MTLLPCGHDPARQFWGKCGVCGSLNRPTVSEPRTAAIFAEHRKCGTPNGYDGCYSHLPMDHCRADGMVWPCDVDRLRSEAAQPIDRFDRSWWHYADDCPASPAAQPIDVERLREAIVKAAAFSDGSLMNLADLAAAEYDRLSGEES